MIHIRPVVLTDISLLTELGRQTFIESHGHSASAEDISNYIDGKYTEAIMREELDDPGNIYHLIYHEGQVAGYSKIIPSCPHPDISLADVTKLERLYLLKTGYGKGLGEALFAHNLQLSQSMGQKGMWLYTWKENPRAIAFYQRAGFKIIGSYDFPISATHSNPNHHMLLEYGT